MEENLDTSILAICSLANKPINEDACIKLSNENANFSAVIVADGLGSNGYASNASAFVVQWMQNKLLQLDDVAFIDFFEFFPLLKHALIAHVENFEVENNLSLDRFQNFGTTLICAIETENEFILAYTGNGSIWHIKGNFNDFSAGRIIPWNSINYLSPHTVEESGREALYKLISPTDNFDEIVPTVIRISKDKNYGDIIMICSDGIFSQDQVRIGKNTTGAWMKIEDCLIDFYPYLNLFFNQKNENNLEYDFKDNFTFSEDNLTEIFQQYLAKGTWDDDATLGIIVSKEALLYQKTRK